MARPPAVRPHRAQGPGPSLTWLGWLACCALPWLGLAWSCLACLASNNNNNNNNLYHGWFVSFCEGFHTAVRTYPYIRRGIFHNTWEFSLPQFSRPLTSAILHFMELMAYRAKPKKWHYPQVVRSTTEDVPPAAAPPNGTLRKGRRTRTPQDTPGRPQDAPKG